MSLPSDTLPSDDEMVLCWKDLDQLFDPRLLISRAYQIWKERGQVFCEHVLSAWTSAVRRLSHDEVNDCWGRHGKTVLNRCLTLLQAFENAEGIVCEEDPGTFRNLGDPESCQIALESFYDKRLPGDSLEEFLLQTCASMTIELVREKLTHQTVETSFSFGWHPNEAIKGDLWKLSVGVHFDRFRRESILDSVGREIGVDLLMALIDKGLPRWSWAGHLGPFQDSLLQCILKASHADRYDMKPDSDAILCIFLAERFSLKELCHLNEDGDGQIALSYAEQYHHFHGSGQGAPWSAVPRVIKEQMEEKVRHFDGSLLELVELARRVRVGLGGNSALFRRGQELCPWVFLPGNHQECRRSIPEIV